MSVVAAEASKVVDFRKEESINFFWIYTNGYKHRQEVLLPYAMIFDTYPMNVVSSAVVEPLFGINHRWPTLSHAGIGRIDGGGR